MPLDPLEVLTARHSPLGLASVDLATGNGSALHIPPHLQEINSAVVDLVMGRYPDKRGLVLSVPPRHGKSTTASVYLPAWFTATFPDKHCVVASAELGLAGSFTRAAGEVVQRNADLLRVELDPKMRGTQAWRVRRIGTERFQGSVRAVGTGGALTGRGASLLIADDLVRSMTDAYSATKRESLESWFDAVASTRLEPGGKIIVIGTRWRPDDLIGHLLETEPDRWLTLAWSALDEGDAPLWPERFSREALEEAKASVGPVVWDALYMSSPEEEFRGGDFEVEKIEKADPADSTPTRIIAALDFAATAEGDRKDADYSALVVVALQRVRNAAGQYEKRFLVTHAARARTEDPFSWASREIRANSPRNVQVYVERRSRSADGKIPVNYLRAGLKGHTQNIRSWKPGAGKEWRAIPAIAAVAAGRVSVAPGDWNRDFVEELAHFPNGAHDDLVDAFAVAVRELDQASGAVSW
jgi:predicted phage terminase large subunit-like protein